MMLGVFFIFFFSWYGDHRDLHVLTHSFPTRRSSDLCRDPDGRQAHRRSAARADTLGADPREHLVRRRRPRARRSDDRDDQRSEEHTSELQSLMRISYAVFCLKKKQITNILHKLNNADTRS